VSDSKASRRRRRNVETIPSATPKPPADPEPTAEPEVESTVQPEPATEPEPAAELEPAAAPPADVPASAPPAGEGLSLDAVLARADAYWRAFRALAARYPLQHIDEPLTREWTRKQMLAHVAAWHDLTSERLLAFTKSGAVQPLTVAIDSFNARVARAAVGRTSGEVLGSLDASFSRLRRQVAQLTDEQLAAHDGWARQVIAANTYDHYEEHAADLQPDLSSAR
jgi:hypothetical protein